MSNYRDSCINIMASQFPNLSKEEIEALVNYQINKNCIVHEIFPAIKIEHGNSGEILFSGENTYG